MKDKAIAALLRVINSHQKQLTSQQEQIKVLTTDLVKLSELIVNLEKGKKEENDKLGNRRRFRQT